MSLNTFHILLIDDDEDDFLLVRDRLRESPNIRYAIQWASSYQAGLAALEKPVYDAILVDYRMGANTGIELIREMTARNYRSPIILLTGQGNYAVDLEAMQAGAADYLDKGEISSSLLDRSIRYAIERKQHEAALIRSEQALRESEGRFRVALSNVAIAVFSTDLDLRYTWFYSTAMGSFPAQFLGKRDDELLTAESARPLLELKQQVLTERRSIHTEIALTFSEGPRRMVVSLEPYYDPKGDLIGVIGALYDVTEQRQLERERIDHFTEMEVQRRLTRYREEERQAIAREIHDGPVQDLSSLIFQLQYNEGNVQNPALNAELKTIRSGLQKTVEDLRDMMNELRSPSIIRFGVAKGILFHLRGFHEAHPELEINTKIEELEDTVLQSDQVKLNLFRIYHEALSNVVHHAQATKVSIELMRVDDHLELSIADNGKGLLKPYEAIIQTKNNHFGLAGMQERARLIGGAVTITSQPGKGTTIKVVVPLGEAAG